MCCSFPQQYDVRFDSAGQKSVCNESSRSISAKQYECLNTAQACLSPPIMPCVFASCTACKSFRPIEPKTPALAARADTAPNSFRFVKYEHTLHRFAQSKPCLLRSMPRRSMRAATIRQRRVHGAETSVVEIGRVQRYEGVRYGSRLWQGSGSLAAVRCSVGTGGWSRCRCCVDRGKSVGCGGVWH